MSFQLRSTFRITQTPKTPSTTPSSTSKMVSSINYPSTLNSLTPASTTNDTSSSTPTSSKNRYSSSCCSSYSSPNSLTPATTLDKTTPSSSSNPFLSPSNPFSTPPPSPPPPPIPRPLRPEEARIAMRYTAELLEISQDIFEIQQEQEDEENLHEANMAWLQDIGADGDKVERECRRHEEEVAGLLGMMRLAEGHVREVVKSRERRVRRWRERERRKGKEGVGISEG
ncbi:MAG: hypothetical protein Q9195_003514 [Heterodermia aff. obscurata]